MNRPTAKLLFLCIFSTLVIIFSVSNCFAKTTVSGRYNSASGKEIVLSLNVKTSGPTNLIVDQNLGKGNVIVATSPPAQKINSNAGEVKWLFRNIPPGPLTLSIKLKSPLRGKPRATVKYRAPGSGGFEELRISP